MRSDTDWGKLVIWSEVKKRSFTVTWTPLQRKAAPLRKAELVFNPLLSRSRRALLPEVTLISVSPALIQKTWLLEALFHVLSQRAVRGNKKKRLGIRKIQEWESISHDQDILYPSIIFPHRPLISGHTISLCNTLQAALYVSLKGFLLYSLLLLINPSLYVLLSLSKLFWSVCLPYFLSACLPHSSFFLLHLKLY